MVVFGSDAAKLLAFDHCAVAGTKTVFFQDQFYLADFAKPELQYQSDKNR